MKEYIIPGKYIYATKIGKQFITSFGTKSTTRKNGGKSFECSDGVWVRPFMKDLKYGENAVKVDIIVTLKRRPHSHKMWLSGKFRHRWLAENRPRYNYSEDKWYGKGGEVWCSFWCDKDYFPDLSDSVAHEVYVTCKRI